MERVKLFFLFVLIIAFFFGCQPSVEENKQASSSAQALGIYADIIQTSFEGFTNGTEKCSLIGQIEFTTEDNSTLPTITIDTNSHYQTIIGFGGSFTESAAYVLAQLPSDKRLEIISNYFSTNGSGYTLTRTHINSCDFSLGSYSYDDISNDINLSNFDISPDTNDLIPFIKDAISFSEDGFKIIASPWSPPAWMKDNNSMTGGGKLLPQYYDVWAKYIVKYIQAYSNEGIKIWAITPQNEPYYAATWESCLYTPQEERDFIKNNLGPRLEEAGLDVKILIYDHNKDAILNFAVPILQDLDASKYVYGTAFHWYSGDNFENLDSLHNQYPDKHLIHTEGCLTGDPKNRYSPLLRYLPGQVYAHDIIGDLNHWTEGWVDWNMVLDKDGGPNHRNNWCWAPVLVDYTSNPPVIEYTSAFYYLRHFSKYIRPGAIRIGVAVSTNIIESTAVVNPDGKIVVIALNRNNSAVQIKLKNGNSILKYTMPAYSIVNFIFDK
jgi:glucosylceramidase